VDRNIPKNFLNLSKIILTAALVVLTIIDLVYTISYEDSAIVYAVNYYTPAIKIATFVSLQSNTFKTPEKIA
jgi:hypothetical protein